MSLLSSRPDRDALIASIALRGLYASTDGATSWSPLGQGAGSATITNRAATILYDPAHPSTFWESGLYNGGGVYRTDDDGLTFTQQGSPTHCHGLSVDWSDPARKTLLAGGHETGRRLLQSLDGGNTWSDIGPNFPATAGDTSWPLILDSRTYLVGSAHTDGAGVFRSTDAGLTWTQVFSGPIRSLPLTATDGTIYWVRDNDSGIISSTDQGRTWANLVGQGTLTTADPGVAELPDGRLAALGGGYVVISRDSGHTWQHVGSPVPYSPVGLAYSRFRKNFFIWHFDCATTPDPVPADGIMALRFDWQTQ